MGSWEVDSLIVSRSIFLFVFSFAVFFVSADGDIALVFSI